MKSRFNPMAIAAFLLIVGLAILPGYFGGKEIVPWRRDFALASAEAAKANKPLFIEFSAGWCGYCQQMAHTTWADKEVAAALEATVPLQVDTDRRPDLVAKYAVGPIPAYVLCDSQGNVVKSGEGYRSPEEFLAWMKGK